MNTIRWWRDGLMFWNTRLSFALSLFSSPLFSLPIPPHSIPPPLLPPPGLHAPYLTFFAHLYCFLSFTFFFLYLLLKRDIPSPSHHARIGRFCSEIKYYIHFPSPACTALCHLLYLPPSFLDVIFHPRPIMLGSVGSVQKLNIIYTSPPPTDMSDLNRGQVFYNLRHDLHTP